MTTATLERRCDFSDLPVTMCSCLTCNPCATTGTRPNHHRGQNADAPMAGEQWTRAQDELVKSALPTHEIAARLGRSVPSVNTRRWVLIGARVRQEMR